MKKLIILLFGILIFGGVVNAIWYNPFTWFERGEDITGFATSCLDGERQCVNNAFEMCDSYGNWNVQSDCSSGVCVTDISSGIIGCDFDGDGYVNDVFGGTDCNDNNPSINPDATERCDGVDNNCDSRIDDGCTENVPTCVDNDRDGYNALSTNCPTGNDCNDNNANVNPGKPEISGNSIDENCDGVVSGGTTCSGSWVYLGSPVLSQCCQAGVYTQNVMYYDNRYVKRLPDGSCQTCSNGVVLYGKSGTYYGLGGSKETKYCCQKNINENEVLYDDSGKILLNDDGTCKVNFVYGRTGSSYQNYKFYCSNGVTQDDVLYDYAGRVQYYYEGSSKCKTCQDGVIFQGESGTQYEKQDFCCQQGVVYGYLLFDGYGKIVQDAQGNCKTIYSEDIIYGKPGTHFGKGGASERIYDCQEGVTQDDVLYDYRGLVQLESDGSCKTCFSGSKLKGKSGTNYEIEDFCCQEDAEQYKLIFYDSPIYMKGAVKYNADGTCMLDPNALYCEGSIVNGKQGSDYSETKYCCQNGVTQENVVYVIPAPMSEGLFEVSSEGQVKFGSNSNICCADVDGDGFLACDLGDGKYDCNDSNPNINPEAVEIIDNDIDENCDGIVETGCMDLDGDYYVRGLLGFDPTTGESNCPNVCGPNQNEPCIGGNDCEDDSSGKKYSETIRKILDVDKDGNIGEHIFPGATEKCDGIDNNCDFIVDEGFCAGDQQCVLFGEKTFEATPQVEGSFVSREIKIKILPGALFGNDAECFYEDVTSQGLFGEKNVLRSSYYSCLPSEEYKLLSQGDIFGELKYAGSKVESEINKLVDNGDLSWQWNTGCVARDKCADGVDNNGFQDVVKEYNLEKEGYFGAMYLKLKDMDDVSCKGRTSPITGEEYCIDEDGDSYCRNSSKFPDCDDNSSDDEEQYKVNNVNRYIDTFSSEGQCSNSCENRCSIQNSLDIGCEVIKNECKPQEFYFENGQGYTEYSGECWIKIIGSKQAVVTQFEQNILLNTGSAPSVTKRFVFEDIVSPEGVFDTKGYCDDLCKEKANELDKEVGISVVGISEPILDTSALTGETDCICEIKLESRSSVVKGPVQISAKVVHPFSSLVYVKEGINTGTCGLGFDINCNKNGVEGYNMDSLLSGGTPFDNDLSTGRELLIQNEEDVDLACQFDDEYKAQLESGVKVLGNAAVVFGTMAAVIAGGPFLASLINPVAGKAVLLLIVSWDIGSGVTDFYKAGQALVTGDYSTAIQRFGGGFLWTIGAKKNIQDIQNIFGGRSIPGVKIVDERVFRKISVSLEAKSFEFDSSPQILDVKLGDIVLEDDFYYYIRGCAYEEAIGAFLGKNSRVLGSDLSLGRRETFALPLNSYGSKGVNWDYVSDNVRTLPNNYAQLGTTYEIRAKVKERGLSSLGLDIPSLADKVGVKSSEGYLLIYRTDNLFPRSRYHYGNPRYHKFLQSSVEISELDISSVWAIIESPGNTKQISLDTNVKGVYGPAHPDYDPDAFSSFF